MNIVIRDIIIIWTLQLTSLTTVTFSKIIGCEQIDGSRDGNHYYQYTIILRCDNSEVSENFDECYYNTFQNGQGSEIRILRNGNCIGTHLDVSLSKINFPYLSTLDISFHGLEELSSENMNFEYLNTFIAEFNGLTNIDRSLFSQCTNLINIDLSFNKINSVEEGAFTSLVRLQTLDLSNNLIETIASDLFNGNTHLQTLDLQNNRIQFNCDIFEPLMRSTTVFISFDDNTEFDINCMQVVLFTESNYFVGIKFADDDDHRGLQCNKISFKNLRTFNISGSPLSNTLETIISLLGPNIETLDMSSNYIGKLSAHTFKKFVNLKYLNLRNTMLTSIDADVLDFLEFPKLESLLLEDNPHLESFNCEFFSLLMHSAAVQVGWDNVKELDLGCLKDSLQIDLSTADEISFSTESGRFGWRCSRKLFQNLRLFNISSSHFQDVSKIIDLLGSSLETLDLSSNFLGKLNANSFTKFDNLRYLNLSRTHLSNFEFNTFYHQRKLKVLDLSYNQLGKVNFTLFFRNFKELATLNLEGNELVEIDTVTRRNFPNLTLLGISKNWFSCDYLTTILDHEIKLMYNPTPNLTHIDGIDCYNKGEDFKINDEFEAKLSEVPKKVISIAPEMTVTPKKVTTQAATAAPTTMKMANRIQFNKTTALNGLSDEPNQKHNRENESIQKQDAVKGVQVVIAKKFDNFNVSKGITTSESKANVYDSNGRQKIANDEENPLLTELRVSKYIFFIMIVACCGYVALKSKVVQKIRRKFESRPEINSIAYQNSEGDSHTASVIELIDNENDQKL